MPPLNGLYRFLSREFAANQAFSSVEDIFLSATLGPKLNDLISKLETPLALDTKVKDDWCEISAYYGRLSPYFFFLCVTSLIGIPTLVLWAYYAEIFWNLFVALLAVIGIAMGLTCGLILAQFLKTRSCNSRYRKARDTYIVDSLRS
jgi:hypothetical protein